MTIGRMDSIKQHAIYPDLLREFKKHGHNIYTISPFEKREGRNTQLEKEEEGVFHLRVKIGNITKCNLVEKGISTLLIEDNFKDAIKKYYSNVKFDLILYSTPPITLVGAIEYVKKRDSAKTYLLLKDIFPQNAVDLGMLKTDGIKGLIYKYFRNKEKRLYEISDKIGCMSPANCEFVIKHNPEVIQNKVEVCPNSIEVIDMRISESERVKMRNKYNIPLDRKVFVYGGNLGKPQGIPFLIDCLKSQMTNDKVYFLIVGDGTEFAVLEKFFNEYKFQNMRLMKRLPKEDYDKMVAACDVGMIFLDHRFTIPNFPSRLLSYMQAGLPVLACTDPNTDIGKIVTDGEFGWWCESNDVEKFDSVVKAALQDDLKFAKNVYDYLLNNYTCEKGYAIVMNQLFNRK